MTLKVGDKVRWKPTGRDEYRVVGPPIHADAADWDWRIERIDTGRRLNVRANEVERIEQPRPLGLQAGDKVVNLKTGREGLVLKGPVSGELKVYDQKPPIKDAVPAQALEEYEFHYPGTYDVWRRVTESKKAQPW